MISNNYCTGCGACLASCPQNCITLRENSIGQLAPIIDKSKCLNCGLCYKTCPQNTKVTENYPFECYACWSKHSDDYIHSASGGVGAVFARYQLNRKAIIFGCDYASDVSLNHFRLNDLNDVSRAQSSKYSQSTSYPTFIQIEQLLNSNEHVVFIGTPCQVAALRSYLRKPYSHLITVDLICHGTPPTHYLNEYINDLNIQPPIGKIRFRGEFDQMLTIWKQEKIVYKNDKKNDLYFSAFYSNIISYDACYSCIYAKPHRVSDITIGDFWGLGKLNEISKMSERPSLVLINTIKGKDFFDSCKNELFYEEREILEGIRGNGRLNTPPGKNKASIVFQFFYKLKFGFSKSVRIAFFFNKINEKVSSIKKATLKYVEIAKEICCNSIKIIKTLGFKQLVCKILRKFRR